MCQVDVPGWICQVGCTLVDVLGGGGGSYSRAPPLTLEGGSIETRREHPPIVPIGAPSGEFHRGRAYRGCGHCGAGLAAGTQLLHSRAPTRETCRCQRARAACVHPRESGCVSASRLPLATRRDMRRCNRHILPFLSFYPFFTPLALLFCGALPI